MAAVKSRTNVTLTFNTSSLEEKADNVAFSRNGETIDVTNLASTGREYITDVVANEITASGFWDATLDGYLAPYVGDGTKYTLVATYDDDSTTITYTWTTNAELSSYEITGAVGSAMAWTATFTLSGSPVRT